MIKGFLTVARVFDERGHTVPTQRAVDLGLVRPVGRKPAGWDFAREEVPLGYNTFVDNGRQLLAYLFGGRTPAASYVCSRFGIGTSNSPTHVGYTDLASPISFYDPGSGLIPTKPVDSIDFPVPFVARVQFTIAANEAVGHLITEYGLYASNLDASAVTLLCRKTELGMEKTSSFGRVILWRVRF